MADVRITREDREKLRKELQRLALKFKSFWQREVPVYTGRYKNSIETRELDNKLGYKVGTNIAYAKKLEEGGGSGDWVDWEDLREWARRKTGLTEDALDAFTAYVQRKIFFEGVEQNQSFMRAQRRFKSWLENR